MEEAVVGAAAAVVAAIMYPKILDSFPLRGTHLVLPCVNMGVGMGIYFGKQTLVSCT